MDGPAILDLWMNHHGLLDADLQKRFLERQELVILAGLPEPAVLQAVARHQKLRRIVTSAAAFSSLDTFREESGEAKAERRSRNASARRADRLRRQAIAPDVVKSTRTTAHPRPWRQFIPVSLDDPEAPANLYLVRNSQLRALKIGVTAYARMDAFEADGWDVLRVWRFAAGYDALEVEERVLDRWRNVFSTGAATTRDDMGSGYSETIRDGAGVRKDIIGFIEQCHDEMSLDPELAADREWPGHGWWEDLPIGIAEFEPELDEWG